MLFTSQVFPDPLQQLQQRILLATHKMLWRQQDETDYDDVENTLLGQTRQFYTVSTIENWTLTGSQYNGHCELTCPPYTSSRNRKRPRVIPFVDPPFAVVVQ